ncbi:hypothetical protein F2Q69_00011012 [Brassica cretica]|uniref:E3 ubiquitin-protein ligase APD1-4 middle domain-containing protein n=1 Tax=Brassica cretica TaxID=69181 RepID=A0A8S9QUY8_BRACR|nr:hypothetical protein F2Q69_00011012 [Brassica cretica]
MDFRLQLFGDRRRGPVSDLEFNLSCVFVFLFGWLLVAVFTHPTYVWIGPNASFLVEPNSISSDDMMGQVFASLVPKVENLYGYESGVQLFGFYISPRGWPYYLNRGGLLNISCNVKPEGCSVRLVVDKVMATRWLWEEPPIDLTALSLNLIQGSGVIQLNISNSESYHLNVANPNLKDLELDIDVKAVVYDTKEPLFYKCNFSNSACTFNTMPFVGTSIVLTSPAHRHGVLSGEQEWFIRISYQARCTSYAIVTGDFRVKGFKVVTAARLA